MKENQIRELVNDLRDIAVEYHGTQQLRERIARTVRAALLQGSQPVSNHDELPYAQVKAVADLYALCWQSGEVVTYTPDPEKATIWLNNYSGTCVQEYVKLERLQEALAGNSPVTPDGWISCSERMPAQDDWTLIYSKYGEYLAGQVQGEYVELNDGTLSWLGAALQLDATASSTATGDN